MSHVGGMRRVAVVGSGGAGKSTFSYELGRRLELPVVSLDAHYWQPGWQRPDREWWRGQQQRLLSGPYWVAEGNYWSTLAVRLQRADTVVFLDHSRWVCLVRVLRRNLRQRGQAVQASDCPEHVSWSFLRYVYAFPRQHRPRLLAAICADPPQRYVHLRTQQDRHTFLAELSG